MIFICGGERDFLQNRHFGAVKLLRSRTSPFYTSGRTALPRKPLNLYSCTVAGQENERRLQPNVQKNHKKSPSHLKAMSGAVPENLELCIHPLIQAKGCG